MPDQPHPDVLRHTADVVSAHLGHNEVATEALPQLIQSVYQALAGLGVEPEPGAAKPEPAVPIRRSVFPDYIVCLEDGAKLKMLKRYIQTRYNLTPVAYRERWGLPADYPMVAPNYAEKRSVLARQIGLGRKSAADQPIADQPIEDVAEVEQDVVASKEPKVRARRKTAAAAGAEE